MMKYSELKFTHKNIDNEETANYENQIANLLNEVSPKSLKKKPLPALTSVFGKHSSVTELLISKDSGKYFYELFIWVSNI